MEVLPAPLSIYSIYPNPATGSVRLDFTSNLGTVTIQLISLDGKIIREVKRTGYIGIRQEELNLGNCQKGIYVVRISDGFSSDTKKLIVR